ncbi:hypothetical protein [Fructilactobacillus frigidiflavus]|uniref:hypothetical protein n=1 Tax=Fructilactobacillus frigidiflavus TaxID=3242688 RepID=UPI00375665CE
MNKNYDKNITGTIFNKSMIDERGTVYLGGFWRDIIGDFKEINVVTGFDWDKNTLYINGATKESSDNYVIKLPLVDIDGKDNFLIDGSGYWDMTDFIGEANRYTMQEIESDPQLAPLKQFAVKVKDL